LQALFVALQQFRVALLKRWFSKAFLAPVMDACNACDAGLDAEGIKARDGQVLDRAMPRQGVTTDHPPHEHAA
jgi:hypothetical protein